MADPFERFLAHYRAEGAVGCTPQDLASLFPPGIQGLDDLIAHYAGASFNGGIYRLHDVNGIKRWNATVGEAFPQFRNRVSCFGWDWLGRQFALDAARRKGGEHLVLLLDPGAGEALEIPATFRSFHNQEIVDYSDAALASVLFKQWRAANDCALGAKECVGYRIPLFLGGKDSLENLEVIDGEVYWTICGQLKNQARTLPQGATIKSVTIS
jgi:hypothetical protein